MYKLILAAPLLVSCSTHTYVNINPHVPADEVILQMDFDGCMEQANAANAQQFASMTQSTGLMEANSYSDPNAQLAQALMQVFLMGVMAASSSYVLPSFFLFVKWPFQTSPRERISQSS